MTAATVIVWAEDAAATATDGVAAATAKVAAHKPGRPYFLGADITVTAKARAARALWA